MRKPYIASEEKVKRKPPKIWSEEQKMILKRLYPDSTMQEMIAALNNEFDKDQIQKKSQKMGIKKSAAFRERFGLDENGRLTGKAAPHNKGKKFEVGGRSAEFHFQKNNMPHNSVPVGTIRHEKEGYLKIKIAERDKWELLHREVWKRENGAYPPDNCVIVFKDGNKENCDISNLEILTRQEFMLRNSMHRFPEELRKVIHLQSVIRRKINARQ